MISPNGGAVAQRRDRPPGDADRTRLALDKGVLAADVAGSHSVASRNDRWGLWGCEPWSGPFCGDGTSLLPPFRPCSPGHGGVARFLPVHVPCGLLRYCDGSCGRHQPSRHPYGGEGGAPHRESSGRPGRSLGRCDGRGQLSLAAGCRPPAGPARRRDPATRPPLGACDDLYRPASGLGERQPGGGRCASQAHYCGRAGERI